MQSNEIPQAHGSEFADAVRGRLSIIRTSRNKVDALQQASRPSQPVEQTYPYYAVANPEVPEPQNIAAIRQYINGATNAA